MRLLCHLMCCTLMRLILLDWFESAQGVRIEIVWVDIIQPKTPNIEIRMLPFKRHPKWLGRESSISKGRPMRNGGSRISINRIEKLHIKIIRIKL